MKLIKEFKEFLKEYKVMSIAIAFILGVAVKDLIKSLVNNIIMPVITPFVPEGGWEQATFTLGPIIIKWGSFLGEIINFLIIAFVIFMIVKILLKEDKITKKWESKK